jgi:hypothetical protein
MRDWLIIGVVCLLTVCAVWGLGALSNKIMYATTTEGNLELLNAKLDDNGPYYVYEFLPDGRTVRFTDGQGVTRTLEIGGEQ